MKRRRFLGTLAAVVATPLAMLVPKRDVEATPTVPLAEPLPGLKPVLVTDVDFAIGEGPPGTGRHNWKIREQYSNGYSRTIWTKRLDMESWFARLNRPAYPDDLPYKHLLAIWDFDSKRIGPGPHTFR